MSIKYNIGGLEGNITHDGEVVTVSLVLDATVATGTVNVGVVHEVTGDSDGSSADLEAEGWEFSSQGAVENDTANLVIVPGRGHLVPVVVDHVRVGEDEGGTGVSNSLERSSETTDAGSELPETVALVYRGVEESVGSRRNGTEGIATSSVVPQVSGEEVLGKVRLDSVEECIGFVGSSGVDGVEGETDKTVEVSVSNE